MFAAGETRCGSARGFPQDCDEYGCEVAAAGTLRKKLQLLSGVKDPLATAVIPPLKQHP